MTASIHVAQSLQKALNGLWGFIPNLLGFLVILIVGFRRESSVHRPAAGSAPILGRRSFALHVPQVRRQPPTDTPEASASTRTHVVDDDMDADTLLPKALA